MYKARIKNNICTNAHPVGCFYHVHEQIIKAGEPKGDLQGKTALVVGASSGVGLASRIALSFTAGMDTIGIYHDRAAQPHKMGVAGWYNNQAFEYYARRSNKMAISSNQDAYQRNAKDWVIQKLQQQNKKLDALVYSLAAPKRSVKNLGDYHSSIKPINGTYKGRAYDPFKAEIQDLEIEAASQDEVDATVKVMGGEDWQEWVNQLKNAGVLADDFKTVAYSYLGSDQNQEIYGGGTIGAAKAHLHETAFAIDQSLQPLNGRAHIGLFQALVSPSSCVIPGMPLYISVLNQLQKESGTFEVPVEQAIRLLITKMYDDTQNKSIKLRVDDLEREASLQKTINQILSDVAQDNLTDLVDVEGYKTDFLRQYGFSYDFINYEIKPDPLTPPSLHNFS